MSAPNFTPMREDDLLWVAEQEREIYPFPWSLNNFRDALSAGYSSWVMRCGAETIGYAVLMLVINEAHLLNISILPQWQKQGQGDCLLAHLKKVAVQNGAASMFLEVRPSNVHALDFYRRRGFEQIGLRKGYYPAAQGREDALVMRSEL
ncbi:ribosomal protein S18-alanine N-acetyltransferase [Uliginosibacterium gangwonense]|uniref:ribosomal protein S18-alanine N-acetyltransferase n=1 Tax=Uliginosibacterium gangwonense TaxID=392736 RepID=UPI000376FD80|nr:ribosomal protein S18-alanine N-acetyltransferase [Uliginosibacterium gangwonense]